MSRRSRVYQSVREEGSKDPIRNEVRELIILTERIRSLLAQGDSMTEKETTIIRVCASELLATLRDR